MPDSIDSDSDIEIVGERAGSPRMTAAEEIGLESVANECLGVRLRLSFTIERQTYDSCLVHSIVNATQRPDDLEAMLLDVRAAGRDEGVPRQDVLAGIRAAKRTMGVVIRLGFDPVVHRQGIAHLNTPCGQGHFIALRKIGAVWALDSLDGSCRRVTHWERLRQRSTLYNIT